MKRISKWLIRMYPVRWRNRYERELEALVEDCGSGWQDAFDVLNGALLMHSMPVVVVGCALLGAVAGFGVSLLLPEMYVSTANIYVLNAPKGVLPTIERALSRGSLTDVINAHTLYPRDMFKIPMEDIVDKMRNHIRVTEAGVDGKFEVSFGYGDRLKARAVTTMLVEKIMAAHLKAGDGSTLQVTAFPDERPVNPYIAKGIICGLAAGVLLGSIVIRVRRPAVA